MIPSELKSARKVLAMSQAEFADSIGVSRVLVGQMERGDAPITPRTSTAVEMLLAKTKLISDVYWVEDSAKGGYIVVRRTDRQHDRPNALYSGHSQTWLYGEFARRDHAYRWAAALRNSADPRNTRKLIRSRETDAMERSAAS
ncbi:helix-turn-helix transcriptional regulator [Sphingobium sp. DC-2]|uniref:helix-turn-helix transcriptional regulator n=1 Tax=Sphingobium sp. DC-2 TaxID=1303256 RepID=UPI0009DEED34|nr:helix-turn-helix transcriptional regulator [Sphingobium sp. DC-2]